MTHPDPETLALSALGEDVLDPVERAHVLACGECHADVTSLRRAADAARGVRTQPGPVLDSIAASSDTAPPPHVWHAVAAELGLSPDLVPDLAGTAPSRSEALSSHGRPTTHARPAVRPVPTPGQGVPPAASRRPGPRGAGTRTIGPGSTGRRRRSTTALLVASVAVIAAAVGSVVTARWLEPADDGPARQAVLAAALTPIEGAPPASGDARVLDGSAEDGNPVLTVTVSGLPEVAGYHGVWLIDADSGEMVSLGVLPGTTTDGTGTFVVPAGLDLSTFDLVDVSDEPLDGDPTHSGVSLLRGVLAAGAPGA